MKTRQSKLILVKTQIQQPQKVNTNQQS